MKRNTNVLILAALLSTNAAVLAQTVLVESWENTLDGWQVPSPGGTNTSFVAGFSNTTGVTDGSYSLSVGSPSTGPNYGQLLLGPSSTYMTALLAGSSQISLDVDTPAASFGYYLQFDIDINNTNTGFVSLENYNYEAATIGAESTLNFSIPSTVTAKLAASSSPTSIIIQVGGGYTAGNETMYLDNLRVTNPNPPPVPVTFSDVNANWVANGGGAWENAANWSSNPQIPGGGPDMIGATITFDNNGGAITAANPTVTLSQQAESTYLTFGSTSGPVVNYTINSGGAAANITLGSELDAYSGNHVINVPMTITSGNAYFDIEAGSVTISNATDGSYGSLTKLGTGTLTIGGLVPSVSLGLNLYVDGTFTMMDNTVNGGWFYGINVFGDGIVNLGDNIFNTNTLSDKDSSGNGLITISASGVLYTALNSDVYYNARLGGAGNIVIGGDVAVAGSDTATHTAFLNGNDSAFSGTMTVSTNNAGPFTLQLVSAAELGNGSATNKLILDGGIFQALGYIGGTQAVNLTANGGTIDSNSFNVVFGAVSSTAGGVLNKINAGMLTVKNMTGIALNVTGGTVQVAPNGTSAGASTLTALTFAVDVNNVPQGSLDITNNKVTITAPAGSDPISTIQGYLLTGYDAGRWDGAGIQSSSVLSQPGTSIGYADGNTDSGTAAAAGTIVVMDTWLGDLNLDGSVTSADLATLTANLGHSGAGVDWAHGDLNYDGKVNGDDLSLLMLGSAEYKAGGSIPVPEPASGALLAIGACAALRRRRR